MSADKPMDGIISLSEPQNLEAIRLKYEHEQKTVWVNQDRKSVV